MAATQNQNNGRSLLSFLRPGPRWLEIEGYQVGDIHTQRPVRIAPDTTMVGNIIAPTIEISGMLYGSTAALETTIKAGGQIWGDVYSGRLQIEPGGTIQGWIGSLDEAAYNTLYEAGTIPETRPRPQKKQSPTTVR